MSQRNLSRTVNLFRKSNRWVNYYLVISVCNADFLVNDTFLSRCFHDHSFCCVNIAYLMFKRVKQNINELAALAERKQYSEIMRN